MEQLYKCPTCGSTKTISKEPHQSFSEFKKDLPDKLLCGYRDCYDWCVKEGGSKKSPLEVLIDAKLAGTESPSSVPMLFSYTFRNNEQAAELALRALAVEGYKIVPLTRTIVENAKTYCITHQSYVGIIQMFKCEIGLQKDENCEFEER